MALCEVVFTQSSIYILLTQAFAAGLILGKLQHSEGRSPGQS